MGHYPALLARDRLLLRIGAAKKEAGRAFVFVKIHLPVTAESVTRQTFSFQLDKTRLQDAEQRDGHYLLRSNLTGGVVDELCAHLPAERVTFSFLDQLKRCIKDYCNGDRFAKPQFQ